MLSTHFKFLKLFWYLIFWKESLQVFYKYIFNYSLLLKVYSFIMYNIIFTFIFESIPKFIKSIFLNWMVIRYMCQNINIFWWFQPSECQFAKFEFAFILELYFGHTFSGYFFLGPFYYGSILYSEACFWHEKNRPKGFSSVPKCQMHPYEKVNSPLDQLFLGQFYFGYNLYSEAYFFH